MKGLLIFLAICISARVNSSAQSSKNLGVSVIPERRVALVIGINNYKAIRPLHNCLNDADDMATALKSLGFVVTLVKDATYQMIQESINKFTQSLKPNDVAAFYYSGHGIGYQGENYLVPLDARISCIEEISAQGIPLKRIIQNFENYHVRNGFMFLDACRNLPKLTDCSDGKKDLENTGLVRPSDNPRGTLITFATREGMTAIEIIKDRNSLFTGELLKYLTKPDLEIREIIDKTTVGVEQRSKLRQIPTRFDELRGRYYFIRTKKPIVDSVHVDPPTPEPPQPIQYPCKLPIDQCVSDSVFFRVTKSGKAQSESAAKEIAIINAMEEITNSFASFIQSETVKYFKSINTNNTPKDSIIITDSTRIKSSLSLTGFTTVCEKYIEDKSTGTVTCYLCGQVQVEYIFMELGKMVRNKKSKFNGKKYEEYLLEAYRKANK